VSRKTSAWRALHQLITPPERPKRKVGFRIREDD
jgi:hypothetical protein